jgi:hypothetical protein
MWWTRTALRLAVESKCESCLLAFSPFDRPTPWHLFGQGDRLIGRVGVRDRDRSEFAVPCRAGDERTMLSPRRRSA